MRVAGYSLLALLILMLAPSAGFAAELRIAAWNLEHLDDTDGQGCIGRNGADYAAIARQIEALGADIVAFQEVENATAARRIFPTARWNVAMSSRPPMKKPRRCRDRPGPSGDRICHLAGDRLETERRPSCAGSRICVPALGHRHHGDGGRPGAAAAAVGASSVRLLGREAGSGPEAEEDLCGATGSDTAYQGVDRRNAEGMPFVILGDFNRRLTLEGDWAWRLLSPSPAALRLLTEGEPFRCDPRFPAFIDHLVAGGGAEKMLEEGSFREWPREGQHPDHCAISAAFRAGS